MPPLVVAQLVLQLIVPLALVGRVALGRRPGRLATALDVALAVVYVLAIATSGPWLALPLWLAPTYLLLIGVAGAVRLGRTREPTGSSRRVRVQWAVVGSLAAMFTVLVGVALAGRRPFADAAVDLVFPLTGGTYLVASGGSTSLVNPHLKTRTGERYRPYRGQTYAVDLVKQGAWGSRVGSLVPDAPTGYAIFGDPIHAPCSGHVVRAVDGHSDTPTGPAAPGRLAGNHVILDCDGVWIVLAHMMRGSVRAVPGTFAATGDVLGLVGNSGRSDEPHLHIHAQTPGTPDAPLGGDPIPITFDGRHLVRSDRIHEVRDGTTSGLSRAPVLAIGTQTTSEDG